MTVATTSFGETYSANTSFTVTVGSSTVLPTTTTSSANSITSNTATITGVVNPNGSDTYFWFQYGTSSSLSGSVATSQQDLGAGTTGSTISANLSSLTSNTTYYYQVWARNGAGTAHGGILSFTTANGSAFPAPSLTSPAAGATGVDVNTSLTWGSVPNSAGYFVYFGSVNPPPVVLLTGITSYTPGTLSHGTTYYWTVSSRDPSNNNAESKAPVRSFTTTSAASFPAPTLISPPNGATGLNINTSLSWSAVNGSAGYTVYFGTVNPPPALVVTAATSYSPAMSPGNTYYWTVGSRDPNNGNAESKAPVQSFATSSGAQPPGTPTNLSPADGSTNVSANVTLSWSAAAGATSYQIYFGPTYPPTALTTVTGTTYSPGPLGGDVTYYWRIVAVNTVGSTSSSTVSFTTATASSGGSVLVSGLTNPGNSLALDSDSVYWTEFNGLIRKVSKSGGTPQTLYSTPYNPSGIAVDATTVYFGDEVSLRAIPKAGGTSTVLTAEIRAESQPMPITFIGPSTRRVRSGKSRRAEARRLR